MSRSLNLTNMKCTLKCTMKCTIKCKMQAPPPRSRRAPVPSALVLGGGDPATVLDSLARSLGDALEDMNSVHAGHAEHLKRIRFAIQRFIVYAFL